MITAAIRAIEFHLPAQTLDNEELERLYADFPAHKILAKTGIATRHVSAHDECASDLAFHAAEKLLNSGVVNRDEIDALLLCTQTPDYLLPTTACVLQTRLGLPTALAAFDFNLGCSGFVYGLGLAKGLIESGQASKVLLLTADTYTRLLDPADRSVRALFGDAAAATLVEAVESESASIGPFVYGTNGEGARHLMVASGGLRQPSAASAPCYLRMDGPEIFNFTLDAVPASVNQVLKKAGITGDDIDLYVFHQANAFMLEHLRQCMDLPVEKFYIHLRETGNTVSSTIPMALKAALQEGRVKPGARVMLVGFGVGLSWAATLVRWV